MESVQFQLFLSLFLLLLQLHLLDLAADGFDMVLGLVNLLGLLSQLEVGVQQQLEEGPNASSGALEGLHVGEDHAVH